MKPVNVIIINNFLICLKCISLILCWVVYYYLFFFLPLKKMALRLKELANYSFKKKKTCIKVKPNDVSPSPSSPPPLPLLLPSSPPVSRRNLHSRDQLLQELFRRDSELHPSAPPDDQPGVPDAPPPPGGEDRRGLPLHGAGGGPGGRCGRPLRGAVPGDR